MIFKRTVLGVFTLVKYRSEHNHVLGKMFESGGCGEERRSVNRGVVFLSSRDEKNNWNG